MPITRLRNESWLAYEYRQHKKGRRGPLPCKPTNRLGMRRLVINAINRWGPMSSRDIRGIYSIGGMSVSAAIVNLRALNVVKKVGVIEVDGFKGLAVYDLERDENGHAKNI